MFYYFNSINYLKLIKVHYFFFYFDNNANSNFFIHHIDNINDDGSIPRAEPHSWESHNSFRLNNLTDPDEVALAPPI